MDLKPLPSDLHLILGGARSGKSRYGESLAKACQGEVLYIATAKALDSEMEQRIAQHKKERPAHWTSIEEPMEISQVISGNRDQFILVDCLTLWLMNLMENKDNIGLRVNQLLNVLATHSGQVVLVSNEISMGVVPMGEISRTYVDELGRMHQRIAQIASNVTLMVAGLPHKIK